MLKTISLYTGAGGLDLGLEAAGFSTAVAVEVNDEAVETLRQNRDWTVVHDSIESMDASSSQLMKQGGVGEGEATLLAGGPPCQPFSKSGYWHSGDAKRLDDPRARTLQEYLRVLRDTKPEAFLLENVPGIAFNAKSEGLQFLRSEIEAINREQGTRYSFAAQELSCVEYGVPQTRRRVFVVGHREGKVFRFPPPTHLSPPRINMATGAIVPPKQVPLMLAPAHTAWDAIGHLEDDDDPDLMPTGKWAGLLPSIPEGRNYLFHTDRGQGHQIFGWRRHFWSMLLKLSKQLPSWTLTAQPGPAIGPFHWKSRRLSARELCALQTFPPDYRISGNLRAAQRQVGNAVPSAMTEILGLAIRQQLFGDDCADPTQPTLVPGRRGAPPPPEPSGPVLRRYLELVGDHSDHPGTGLGNGAVARAQA